MVRGMLKPTVTETTRALDPVTRDPFMDGPQEPPEPPEPPSTHPHDEAVLDTPEPSPSPDRELVAIVKAAADGDAAALCSLVDRYDRALRSVTRFYRLSSWDADDVVQMTWLQFLRYGRALREPAAVSGWLMTTARRRSLKVLQGTMREQPTDDPLNPEAVAQADPLCALLAAECRSALIGALEELPDRHRRLMTLLLAKPDMSYEQVGRAIGMPTGSIGPIRARSLARLQRSTRLRALRGER